jgi:hypothetical protein
MTILEGSVVRVEAGGKPRRPGVVLRVHDRDERRYAFVVWGTGTLRAELRHVAVDHRERAGIVLQLEKPTYFYERYVWTGPIERLELTGRLCPPGLLVKLQALVGA